jgi:hypothetical protein
LCLQILNAIEINRLQNAGQLSFKEDIFLWKAESWNMVSFEEKLLEKIIRESLSVTVKDVHVEDSRTKERLEYLDDLKPDTTISIHLVPVLGRDMTFSLTLSVGSDRSARRTGVYGSSFPKVAEGEDVGKYLGQMGKCEREIADGLNRALKGTTSSFSGNRQS